MAKVDAKSAYRNVPVHPDDRWLMGMMWDGALYVDTALPFGLRSAPKIFTAIANAVEWIVRQEGVKFAIHCLDDFLVVGAPDSPECAEALDTLRRVFSHLGLPVAIEKLEGPWYCLNFLGFELGSLSMVIRLPQAKLTELQQLIQLLHQRRAGVPCWETSSRQQGGTAWEDIHAEDVRAPCRYAPGSPPQSIKCFLSFGLVVVGHVPGVLEWCRSDAVSQPESSRAFPSCGD